MLTRTLLGIVGVTGLYAGVWFLVHEGRRLRSRTTWRDQLYGWLLRLDSLMAAIGWSMWMGLFGTLVAFSINGQTIF